DLRGRGPARPGEQASDTDRRIGERMRGADPGRDPRAALPAYQPVRAEDRRRALPLGKYRQDASAPPVPKARRAQSPRGRGAGPRPGPARSVLPSALNSMLDALREYVHGNIPRPL